MECKNCNLALRTDYSYCSNCGAKVIRNRITLKNLWYDFTERFFNLDNTFLLTFKHLFTKPDAVIVGYINGVRKKYMNPISYFTIAVFLGGIFFFLNKKFFPDAMNFENYLTPQYGTPDSQKLNGEFLKNYQDIVQEYQNLLYMISIPFLALISRLVFFNKKQFNLSEHFVINIYAYTQTSIVVNIIYILSIWSNKLIYWEASFNFIFLIAYFSYVYKKTFNLDKAQILLKLMLFLVVLGILFFILIILVVVYLIVFSDTFKNLKEAQAMLIY